MSEADSSLTDTDLDNAIAERVMGWYLQEVAPSGVSFWGWVDKAGAVQCNFECWQPSTDMNPAMEVIEGLDKERGWRTQMQYHNKAWCVQIDDGNCNDLAFRAGDSLPEIICRAALDCIETK